MKTYILLSSLVASAYAFCPNSCSGNGECGENDKCICYDRFEGADCSLRQCPYGVSWVTAPAEVLHTASVPGYKAHDIKGYHTDISADGTVTSGPVTGFHAYTECASKGLCDHVTGQCKCFAGYEGLGCRRSECPNSCGGHGRCVLDADVWQTSATSAPPVEQMYGNDQLLASTKQYWNNKKTTQCLCDAGFTGADCTTRICPKGDDPASSCSTELAYSNIQAVGLFYETDVERARADQIEQFFTLTFTDMFNNEFETKALSYWDDARTVQQALMGLPGFGIVDVEVFKFWPEDDDETAAIASDGGVSSICAQWYHETFRDVTCLLDADCQAKFGLPAIDAAEANLDGQSVVFCDLQATLRATSAAGSDATGLCVETQQASCIFDNGISEFAAGCATRFEPDGLYDEATPEKYWGRRLTSFERSCHIGKFVDDAIASSDGDCLNLDGSAATETTEVTCLAAGLSWRAPQAESVAYTLACASDQDCRKCGGWTSVVSGVCNTAGVCSSLGTVTAAGTEGVGVTNTGNIATNQEALFPLTAANLAMTDADLIAFNAACRTTVLMVKFSDAANAGKQNILKVVANNEDTNSPGASPKFRSAGVRSMGVVHAGIPDFQAGRVGRPGEVQDNTIVLVVPTAEGVAAGGTMQMQAKWGLDDAQPGMLEPQNADSSLQTVFTLESLNAYPAVQNLVLEAFEGDKEDIPKQVLVNKKIYTEEEILAVSGASYDEVLQCSNQGACGYDTGLCTCASGFTGESCGTQVSFV